MYFALRTLDLHRKCAQRSCVVRLHFTRWAMCTAQVLCAGGALHSGGSANCTAHSVQTTLVYKPWFFIFVCSSVLL